MSSRRLIDLRDDVRQLAQAHVEACAAQGVDLLIYCTLRSNEEQTALYARGRTAPGKIVTNARAGESLHNPDASGKARAYDCVPLVGGKPVWGSASKEELALWHTVGACGEQVGLVWAGRWTGKLREQAHFQVA